MKFENREGKKTVQKIAGKKNKNNSFIHAWPRRVLNTLAVIAGKLPPRALGLVMEWASLHQNEILSQWEKARNMEALDRIEPLK